MTSPEFGELDDPPRPGELRSIRLELTELVLRAEPARARITAAWLRTVRPMKWRMHSASGMSQPLSASRSRSTPWVIGSLSTRTPSQSNRIAP